MSAAAQALRDEGATAFSAKNYTEAYPKFTSAFQMLEKLPDSDSKKSLSLSCSLNAASCCVALKTYPDAVEWATKALDIDRKNAKAMYRRGQALREMGEFSKARFDLMMASEIAPDPDITKELQILREQQQANPGKGQSVAPSMPSMPSGLQRASFLGAMPGLPPSGLYPSGAPAPLSGGGDKPFDEKSFVYPSTLTEDKERAQGGDARAMNKLGDAFDDGTHGVSKNKPAAFYWYQKAAQAGDAQGQNNLAYCYKTGTGTVANSTQAIQWYEKAAEQGYNKALACLGYCYEKGDGVTVNLEKAGQYYARAAENGDVVSQANLALMYEKGLGGLVKDEVRALHWHRTAAEGGNVNAQINVGLYFEKGIGGVAQDWKQAVSWYSKAAEKGDHTAQTIMGACYEKGLGVEKNEATATDFYLRAAMQGNMHAKEGLKRLNGDSLK